MNKLLLISILGLIVFNVTNCFSVSASTKECQFKYKAKSSKFDSKGNAGIGFDLYFQRIASFKANCEGNQPPINGFTSLGQTAKTSEKVPQPTSADLNNSGYGSNVNCEARYDVAPTTTRSTADILGKGNVVSGDNVNAGHQILLKYVHGATARATCDAATAPKVPGFKLVENSVKPA